MRQVTDFLEYQSIAEKYGIKGAYSNVYFQNEAADLIVREKLFVDCYERNAFFYVKKVAGMRVYYYINDLEELADFSEYEDLVVEVLFRGDIPKEEMKYLIRCGFQVNIVRDQYAGTYKDLYLNVAPASDITVEKAQSIEDVKTACELFNESFDKLSGDFVPECEYETLLRSGSIILALDYEKQHLYGALHQVKEGPVNVIGHVAVMKHARGHGVGKVLVDAFVEWNKNETMPEKTRYQLWVQRHNEAAVRMYENKGFKYTNKSTISLIKQ